MSNSSNGPVDSSADPRVISHVSIPVPGVDACNACGSEKIARSQLEKFDSIKVFLLGKQPYRCLHCYHRFWVPNTEGRMRKRLLLLLVLVLLIAALSYFGGSLFTDSESEPSVSIIVPVDNAENSVSDDTIESRIEPVTIDDQAASPSLASLVDVPEQSENLELSTAKAQFNARNENNLSEQQQAELLLQAKQQAQNAEQASKARVEQLEQVLAPELDELKSLMKVEISYVLERWREAWSNGDIETYLQTYSDQFVPANDLALATWRSARRNRVTPEKKIVLRLSDFEVTMTNGLNEAVIEFDQRYQSGSYIDNSRKQLSLIKQNGDWRITQELELK